MKKLCEICKSEFDVRPSRAEFRKTCSRQCSGILKTQLGAVKSSCHNCGKEVIKTKSQIEKSKSGYVFCSNECVGKFNSDEKTHGIKKTCLICTKEFTTIEARKETHIVCSKECHAKWQSEYRKGDKAGNFRGGGGSKECEQCGKIYTVNHKSQFERQKYCSRECKHEFWKQNTLHNKKFKIAHFNGNLKYRLEKNEETKPEKLVREYLESRGLVKGIDFFQEKGFFRRYFADFFIPKTMSVIEVNGDFWHGNPEVYGEGLKVLYESQIERMQKDVEKQDDFIKYGFNYHVLWEKDIYENLEKLMKKIQIQ